VAHLKRGEIEVPLVHKVGALLKLEEGEHFGVHNRIGNLGQNLTLRIILFPKI